MKKSFCKNKIITSCLIGVLALSGIMVTPITVKAADEVYYDTTGTYKMADYWTESKKQVPVLKDYVFGGWYAKDGEKYVPLNENALTNETVKDITAYPKFVPAEVLSVKTQLGKSDTETSLRLVSTVDSKDYQKVGFEVQLGSRDIVNKEMTRVYSGIKKSKTDTTVLEPDTTFVTASEYFIAVDISNISDKSYASIVYARAYWETMDGTTVMGLARNNRVEDKTNNYISVPVNLLTDGATPAMVAGGKIQVTYNSDAYKVVGSTVDAGRVLSEIAYFIDEDAGTITFAGNATKVDKNIIADGLYVNVRFVKKNENAGDLNFAVKTDATSFCNWIEELIDSKAVVVQ
jgi:hypothetical protein